MRPALWENLYGQLARSIFTFQSHQDYGRLRRRRPCLRPFPDPAALIDYLHDSDSDLDAKDGIYAGLVEEVQTGTAESQTASGLIWLGLWPGLDATWCSLGPLFAGEEHELVAALSDHFTRHVNTISLASVTRVAASLVWNTRRDVRKQRARHWAEEKSTTELPADDLLPSHEPDHESDETRKWVWTVLDADAELVLLVLVQGLNLKEAAQELGITHGAARQRYHRALRRLRLAHAEIDL